MLTFFREKKWSYLQEASSHRRGFFFSLCLGFEKELNPLSGFTVSLPKVDGWMQEFIEAHPRGERDAESLLMGARKFFAAKAKNDHAKLRFVSIQEERGWAVSWDNSLPEGELFFESRHYLEYAPEGGPADLRRITLAWRKSGGDHFDYFSESLQLLKQTKATEWTQKKPEKNLSPTSHLAQVRLESLSQNWKLEL